MSKFNDFNKNVDELIKVIGEFREITNNQISKTESQIGIPKIQNYHYMLCNNLKIVHQKMYGGYGGSMKFGFYITARWGYDNKYDKYRKALNDINEETHKKTDSFSRKILYSRNEDSINKVKNELHLLIDRFVDFDKNHHELNLKVLENNRKKLKDQITEKCDELIKQIKKEESEKLAKEKEKKDNKVKALLLSKYDLELTDGWETLLDVIIDKDKYLNLAHAMLQTRNDWSCGFYKVDNAICSFKAETDYDKRVKEDILVLLSGEERDGRIFRDCKYSYDVLFEKVDSNIIKDYNLVFDKVSWF